MPEDLRALQIFVIALTTPIVLMALFVLFLRLIERLPAGLKRKPRCHAITPDLYSNGHVRCRLNAGHNGPHYAKWPEHYFWPMHETHWNDP